MRNLLLTLSLFLSLGMLADHHKKSDKDAKNSPKNKSIARAIDKCIVLERDCNIVTISNYITLLL